MNTFVILAADWSFGWPSVTYILIGIIAGLVAGYFIARKVFTNQLKKNPPINEKMIRAMFLSMGRKPSEAQIKQVMKNMNQYK
ncbi:MAG: YneF family protein [Bacillales bacterium]|nr:YneF family protein [Bacillales bacterium]